MSDRIVINEVDLTTNPAGRDVTDIVFVPIISDKADAPKEPTLCRNIAEFESYFGDTPYKYAAAQSIPYSDSESILAHRYKWKFLVSAKATDDDTALSVLSDKLLELGGDVDGPSLTTISALESDTTIPSRAQIKYPNDGFASAYYIKNSGTDDEEAFGYAYIDDYYVVDPTVATGYVMYNSGDFDRNYLYAKEILFAGLPVLCCAIKMPSETDIETANAVIGAYYAQIGGILEKLKDKGEYSVKYITTGALPNFFMNSTWTQNVVAAKMFEVASYRGDCCAIIDHLYKKSDSEYFPLTGEGSAYETVKAALTTPKSVKSDSAPGRVGKFATTLTPWAKYLCSTAPAYDEDGEDISQVYSMPASFGYCLSTAESIKNYDNWLAIAGVTRGLVPNIIELDCGDERLSNSIADSFQPRNAVAINAITNIRPEGLTIWGNRTLWDNSISTPSNSEDGLIASSFLNIRNMVSDVKKLVYTAAKELMFEQNTTVLWINFKSKIMPFLDRLVSGNGLVTYKIIQERTTERAKLKAKVILIPTYAVENFDITIVLTDTDVEVE